MAWHARDGTMKLEAEGTMPVRDPIERGARVYTQVEFDATQGAMNAGTVRIMERNEGREPHLTLVATVHSVPIEDMRVAALRALATTWGINVTVTP